MDLREAAQAEVEAILDDLRAQMTAARGDSDPARYITLANRYGPLHQHWEALVRSASITADVIRHLEEARKLHPDWRDFRVTV